MPLRRPRALAPFAFVPLVLALLSVPGCSLRDREHPVFELLSAQRTGVTFANTITTTDTENIQSNVYIYNGAGVAVGDVDNDGLPDIFFAGNQVSSRLYRNKGGMRFEDVTASAGVGTARWATGVAMVDINGDGHLDIYVSVSGSGSAQSKPADRANLLFVNNGDGTFTEAAAEYGLADTGFSTQAAFLDYDGDGCLDLFLLNNSPQDFSRGADIEHPTGMRGETLGSYNELYRNECRPGTGAGHGKFVNVSEQAGILRTPGYGLGVAIADFNRDGRPDIYVSNDASPNDVLYVNNGNGTFTDKAGRWLKHTSAAGMGIDVADFNDDGWPDIVQADMMAHDLDRQKRTIGVRSYSAVLESRRRGYRLDYSMNALQLSNGVTRDGDVVFSEVSRLAGVEATDWSWSALFADFDNDGRKDIFISSGFPKSVNDADYQNAMLSVGSGERGRRAALERLAALPAYDSPNRIFQNVGDLAFTDRSAAWGMGGPSLSYGAAYADLDNDGRLDLVVNNIDAPAFIYHNVARTAAGADSTAHWLQVRLHGESPNVQGIGATLTLFAGGRAQHVYHSPYRGYMSTMDDRAYFGLGAAGRVDSLVVTWPDRRRQTLRGLAADRLVTVLQKDAAAALPTAPPALQSALLEPLDAARTPAFAQMPAPQVDYALQPLLPYQVSRHGPPLAVGDVDGDGLEDVFVGGGPTGAARLFMQRADGRFEPSVGSQPWAADSVFEDWGALFFDANGDGRPDLYVTSGGYQLPPNSRLLQDRLYINQGGGRFVRDSAALPTMLTSTAVVRAGDFDGDGQLDLFVGGRLSPGNYPNPARSYLLHNNGGRFVDVTDSVAPELARGGMITDAAWIDFDGDGRSDLVTVGEWMPISFYRNVAGSRPGQARFVDATAATGLPPTRGWWYSLAVGDFDGDGRPDLVAGNLGLNHSYRTSAESKFGVYAADFTGNQTTSVVLTQKVGGADYPIAGIATLGRAIYTLDVRFPTAGSFSIAPLSQMFDAAALKKALHYEADTFASLYVHNAGGGRFTAAPLPNLAQIAPIRGIVVNDVDGDGHPDVIVAGNLYDTETGTARADAGNGLLLRGDPARCRAKAAGCAPFIPVPPIESGFLAPGDVSGLALIGTPDAKVVLVANTADSVRAFAFGRRQRTGARR